MSQPENKEKQAMERHIAKSNCPHCGASKRMGLTGKVAHTEPPRWICRCTACNKHCAVGYQAVGNTDTFEIIKLPKGSI